MAVKTVDMAELKHKSKLRGDGLPVAHKRGQLLFAGHRKAVDENLELANGLA